AQTLYFGTGWLDTPAVQGGALAAGAEVAGPALIEEAFTVVAVPPGWHARLADHPAYEAPRAGGQPPAVARRHRQREVEALRGVTAAGHQLLQLLRGLDAL